MEEKGTLPEGSKTRSQSTKPDSTNLQQGPQQLYDKAGNALDMSKRCNYCQNVKKWRGYGHLEKDCKTKARETGGSNAPAAAKPAKLDLDDIDGGVTINRLFVRMVKVNNLTAVGGTNTTLEHKYIPQMKDQPLTL